MLNLSWNLLYQMGKSLIFIVPFCFLGGVKVSGDSKNDQTSGYVSDSKCQQGYRELRSLLQNRN